MEINRTIAKMITFIFFIGILVGTIEGTKFETQNQIYLMISKDGVITMKNQGKTIWEYSLHKPVVETKINVKNLNFEEENILPGEDGNLYLINSKKEKFTLLNYTIKDIVNNEILTFEKEKKNFFTKKKIIHSFGIDFFSGKKISNPEKQNHNVIFFKEIKYGLQYNYNESLSFWNASLTTFDISTNQISFQDLIHLPTGGMVSRGKGGYEEFNENNSNFFYIFKFFPSTNKFIEIITSTPNDKQMYQGKHFSSTTQNLNLSNYLYSFSFRFYINVIMFLLSAMITSSLLFAISNIKNNENNNHNLLLPKNENFQKISSFPLISKYSYKSIIEDSYSDKNYSNLSTISLMNKSFDDYPIKSCHTFHHSIGYLSSHKNSAPEIESKKFEEDEKLRQNTNSFVYYEEQLAPNKSYKMNKIDTSQQSIPNKTQKSIDNIINKKKFKPNESDLSLLNTLSLQYLTDKSKYSTESLYKLEQCESVSDKYFEIYKIINRKRENDSNDTQVSIDLIKSNANFSLCDTGRFINSFDNIQLIDKGGFGTVFKAMHKIDGCYYAIKIIRFELGIDDKLSSIKEVSEIKTMMKMEHKNIVRYITCWFEFEDMNLFGKRGRALSMDEKEQVQNSSKSRKRLSNFCKKDNNNEKEKISDLELVVNEDKDNDYFNCNDGNDMQPKFYDNENDSDFDSYSFSSGYNNNRNHLGNSIVFGSEEENNNFSNTSSDANSMKTPIGQSKLKLNHEIKIIYPLYFYMQMEYCEGCPLSFFLQNRTEKTKEPLIITLFHQLTRAISHIHSKGIIHRDLKPANIFVNKEYKIKIGDFGLASEKKVSNDKVGTFLYQSPEQIEGKSYTEKVDIYALGLILLEMCLFFQTESERRSVLMNVRKGILPREIEEYSNECKLVRKMTKVNVNERPSINDVINSNEMKEMMEIIYKKE